MLSDLRIADIPEQALIAKLQGNQDMSMSAYRDYTSAWERHVAKLLGMGEEGEDKVYFRDFTRVLEDRVNIVNSSETTVSAPLTPLMTLKLVIRLPENSQTAHISAQLETLVQVNEESARYLPFAQAKPVEVSVSATEKGPAVFESLEKAFQYVTVALVSEHFKGFGMGVTDATNAAMFVAENAFSE